MKKIKDNRRNALPVMEQYYTIQGEGTHSGAAAYFIRLAGCPVGCHWCDVKESWKANDRQWMNIEDMVSQAVLSGTKTVVITGGEPAIYDLTALTRALKQSGMRAHLETSGAIPIRGLFHWICVSPKKRMAPLEQSLAKADELKVIVYNKDDFRWAEKNAKKVSAKCRLLLQPEWGKREEALPRIIEYVQEHPQWKISLQTHKYMGIN